MTFELTYSDNIRLYLSSEKALALISFRKNLSNYQNICQSSVRPLSKRLLFAHLS